MHTYIHAYIHTYPPPLGLLSSWIARATDSLSVGGADADGRYGFRHASAAAQLLGAAAATNAELFASLCRGPVRKGETVRVNPISIFPSIIHLSICLYLYIYLLLGLTFNLFASLCRGPVRKGETVRLLTPRGLAVPLTPGG